MISLSAHRSATSVPHSDYNEPQLSQTGIINIINCETCRHIFEERSRINIRNDRINLCRVKVGRFPHHAIQIGHSIGSFYLKAFRCFPSHLIDRLQIGLFQRHNHLSIPVTNHIHRFLRNSRIRIYHISVRRRDTDIMWRILRSQQTNSIRTIQLSFIKNVIIRVNAFLTTITIEIHLTPDSINLGNRASYPCSIGQLVL